MNDESRETQAEDPKRSMLMLLTARQMRRLSRHPAVRRNVPASIRHELETACRPDQLPSEIWDLLTKSQTSLLHQKLSLLEDCLQRLRPVLAAPDLKVSDLRQMTVVVNATGLNREEKTNLIVELYSQIHCNPQWTERGNRYWVRGKLDRAIDSKAEERKRMGMVQ